MKTTLIDNGGKVIVYDTAESKSGLQLLTTTVLPSGEIMEDASHLKHLKSHREFHVKLRQLHKRDYYPELSSFLSDKPIYTALENLLRRSGRLVSIWRYKGNHVLVPCVEINLGPLFPLMALGYSQEWVERVLRLEEPPADPKRVFQLYVVSSLYKTDKNTEFALALPSLTKPLGIITETLIRALARLENRNKRTFVLPQYVKDACGAEIKAHLNKLDCANDYFEAFQKHRDYQMPQDEVNLQTARSAENITRRSEVIEHRSEQRTGSPEYLFKKGYLNL